MRFRRGLTVGLLAEAGQFRPIGMPPDGALVIAPVDDGADVSASFMQTAAPGSLRLHAVEDGAVLADQTWYRITPLARIFHRRS